MIVTEVNTQKDAYTIKTRDINLDNYPIHPQGRQKARNHSVNRLDKYNNEDDWEYVLYLLSYKRVAGEQLQSTLFMY